jgi:hypothetical protein
MFVDPSAQHVDRRRRRIGYSKAPHHFDHTHARDIEHRDRAPGAIKRASYRALLR